MLKKLEVNDKIFEGTDITVKRGDMVVLKDGIKTELLINVDGKIISEWASEETEEHGK